MKPSSIALGQHDLFKIELDKIVDKKDPLILLADLINWDYLHKEFSKYYKGKTGKPPKSIRLMTGLLVLEYIYKLHDAEVISNLERNVYYQYFCGFYTIQTTKIISRSTLVKFRKKIGVEGSEIIFNHTVDISKQLGILKEGEKKVITDTTAIEKNIKYPTDTELLETTRKKLVKEAKKQNLIKRDKYAKKGPQTKIAALASARGKNKEKMKEKINFQKEMLKATLDTIIRNEQKEIKNLKDLKSLEDSKNLKNPAPQTNLIDLFESKVPEKPKEPEDPSIIGASLADQIEKAIRLLYPKKGNKLYSNHESHTYCIAKGKTQKKYEYGHKLSIVIDHSSGILISSQAILENKYDGDILDESIIKAEEVSGKKIEEIYADKGYRKKTNGKSGTARTIEKAQIIHISGTKSENKKIKKDKKRRSLVESRISELKRMCRGSINYLKGKLGDKINASFVGLAENIRIIMRHISVT